MKKIGICVTVLLSLCLSFNAFAMVNSGQGWPEIYIPNPATETRHDDRTLDYVWTWLDDEVVARFQPGKRAFLGSLRLVIWPISSAPQYCLSSPPF